MHRRLLAIVVLVFLVAGACGDDDSTDAASDTGTETAGEATGSGSASDSADDASPPAGTGQGTATVTLDNGESFDFGLLCVLEPQSVGDSEILFTATSYDDPYNLDITQFAADSFGGAANITISDSTTYDTVWDASSIAGTPIELTLDGTTITGSGTFVGGGANEGMSVPGTLEASC